MNYFDIDLTIYYQIISYGIEPTNTSLYKVPCLRPFKNILLYTYRYFKPSFSYIYETIES